jgi:FixJ family two-component response regulator
VRDVNWAKVDRSNVLKKNEKEILEYIVMDFEAKEIARILNCSVSHIYNMRSRIRQALDISADAQIKDWVLERMA